MFCYNPRKRLLLEIKSMLEIVVGVNKQMILNDITMQHSQNPGQISDWTNHVLGAKGIDVRIGPSRKDRK